MTKEANALTNHFAGSTMGNGTKLNNFAGENTADMFDDDFGPQIPGEPSTVASSCPKLQGYKNFAWVFPEAFISTMLIIPSETDRSSRWMPQGIRSSTG